MSSTGIIEQIWWYFLPFSSGRRYHVCSLTECLCELSYQLLHKGNKRPPVLHRELLYNVWRILLQTYPLRGLFGANGGGWGTGKDIIFPSPLHGRKAWFLSVPEDRSQRRKRAPYWEWNEICRPQGKAEKIRRGILEISIIILVVQDWFPIITSSLTWTKKKGRKKQ